MFNLICLLIVFAGAIGAAVIWQDLTPLLVLGGVGLMALIAHANDRLKRGRYDRD